MGGDQVRQELRKEGVPCVTPSSELNARATCAYRKVPPAELILGTSERATKIT